jgi:hypothetical protein
MADHPLVRELRRVLNAELPEYVRDLVQAVPDDLMRNIVADNRHPIHLTQDPAAKVLPVGAGRVVDGTDTVAHGGSGWVTPPQVDAWRPPGVEIADRLLDQAAAIDRAERVRQLAEAAAVQRAEAALKEQPKEKEPEEKQRKERKDRESK